MTNNIRYTSFDFETIRAELIDKLSQTEVFKDYDFSGSNINQLLELFSAIGDLFNFYINMSANESYIQTAQLYENVNKLAYLIGYNPRGYTSSETVLNLETKPDDYPLFTPIDKDGYKINIPRFSRFTTNVQSPDGEDIYFTNINNITFVIDTATASPSGSVNFDVPLIQGNPIDIGNELIYSSEGGKNQRYIIEDNQAVEKYMIVTVDGVEWKRVDNMFRNIDASSKVFTTRYNKDEKVEVKFGDGIFGLTPTLGAEIKIRYIISLGIDGNVGPNSITSISSTITETDTGGISVSLDPSVFQFNQPDTTEGGQDPETKEEIVENAPASFRTQNRAVTTQDYVDLITSEFSEFILHVKAFKYEDFFSNNLKISERLNDTEILTLETTLESLGFSDIEIENIIYSPPQLTQSIYYNNIYVVAVPRFGKTLSDTLKTQMDNFLEDYKMATLNHVYYDATYVDINTRVTYTQDTSSGKTITEIEMDIKNVIVSYFNKLNRDIGENLLHSDLVNSLQELDGIKSVIFEIWRDDSNPGVETNANIQLGTIEFPQLKTNTILLDA